MWCKKYVPKLVSQSDFDFLTLHFLTKQCQGQEMFCRHLKSLLALFLLLPLKVFWLYSFLVLKIVTTTVFLSFKDLQMYFKSVLSFLSINQASVIAIFFSWISAMRGLHHVPATICVPSPRKTFPFPNSRGMMLTPYCMDTSDCRQHQKWIMGVQTQLP